MITFKCKMCGGDLHPEENATTCECEYCGSVQTIPTADNEKKGNLFNRANRLRMAAEYDKAAAVYTSITAEFPEEAEAYWGLCLCKYGIEYVEDPVTAKKIPTCHRTRSESIMDDPDFDQACENADAVAKRVYREEAKAIDRLQQDILSVVANESPYDVFICYKETDDDGQRTEDSVLAQDIYDALTAKGLKVFFARITLEDKLGQQYEPYIYAALHSAKVMLAIGTQFEFFDAVWVKNEWSRFLDMMKSDKSKTLIPCYKDIDAYDMPREFKNLQAQDMGKLGWLQDLTRGVMKLCGKDETNRNQSITIQHTQSLSANPTADSLLKRAFVFLEDEAWNNAVEYADKVLDINVENGQAYLVKLMAKLRVKTLDEFVYAKEPFENDENYQKIQRFGDDALKRETSNYLLMVYQHNAQAILEAAQDVNDIKVARCILLKNPQYKGYSELLELCDEKQRQFEKVEEIQNQLENARMINILFDRLNEKRSYMNSLIQGIQWDKAEVTKLRGFFNATHRRELEERIASNEQKLMETKKKKEDIQAEILALDNPETTKDDIQELRYQLGNLYMKLELTKKAYAEFKQIRNYKNVSALLAGEDFISAIADDDAPTTAILRAQIKVGKTVYFGHYVQSNNTSTGAEKIEWLVLAEEDGLATLISVKALDCKPYNILDASVTWETSTLRRWLNGDFLNAAFSADEQTLLENVKVPAVRNPEYPTNPGADTRDRVFLLSSDEAQEYFPDNEARKCYQTDYAMTQGPKTANYKDACWWWLRSPGHVSNYVVCVVGVGSIRNFGYKADLDYVYVRPVIVVRVL